MINHTKTHTPAEPKFRFGVKYPWKVRVVLSSRSSRESKMTIFKKFYRAVFRLRHHRLFDDVIGEEKYFSLQIPTNYTSIESIWRADSESKYNHWLKINRFGLFLFFCVTWLISCFKWRHIGMIRINIISWILCGGKV